MKAKEKDRKNVIYIHLKEFASSVECRYRVGLRLLLFPSFTWQYNIVLPDGMGGERDRDCEDSF